MCLVFYSWLTRQEYFADLIETAKNKYSQNETNPEEDNTLFMMSADERDPDEVTKDGWSDGNFVWFPT
jgi:hypothetical protein